MANQIWKDRVYGTLEGGGKIRVLDYLEDQSAFAPVRAAILYDSDEIELGTPTNPICVTGGSGGALEVGSDLEVIVQTPAITAGAYTAGDAIGGLLTFASAARAAGRKGEVVQVSIIDDAKQSAPIDIVLFNQTFTSTADNAAFDPSDADLQNCLGYVSVANTDYAEFNDNCVATKSSGLQMPFSYELIGTSLFGQMVTRIGDTWAATDDLTVKLTVRRF